MIKTKFKKVFDMKATKITVGDILSSLDMIQNIVESRSHVASPFQK